MADNILGSVYQDYKYLVLCGRASKKEAVRGREVVICKHTSSTSLLSSYTENISQHWYAIKQ